MTKTKEEVRKDDLDSFEKKAEQIKATYEKEYGGVCTPESMEIRYCPHCKKRQAFIFDLNKEAKNGMCVGGHDEEGCRKSFSRKDLIEAAKNDWKETMDTFHSNVRRYKEKRRGASRNDIKSLRY